MLNYSGHLRKKFITKDEQNFELKEWIQAQFTNVGEASVIIEGVTLKTGESFDASVGHWPVTSNISIKFDAVGSKKVVVNYGVIKTNC